jgi:hypothetical protein
VDEQKQNSKPNMMLEKRAEGMKVRAGYCGLTKRCEEWLGLHLPLRAWSLLFLDKELNKQTYSCRGRGTATLSVYHTETKSKDSKDKHTMIPLLPCSRFWSLLNTTSRLCKSCHPPALSVFLYHTREERQEPIPIVFQITWCWISHKFGGIEESSVNL